jgi:general secretion pathway protein G
MFLTSARGLARVRRCSRFSGFTLIELLVSLAILGALASLTLPVAQVALQRTQEQELRRSLREIRVAIDAYKRAGDEGRIQKVVGASGYPASLRILVDGVVDQSDPKQSKIYFLRRMPRDPLNPDMNLSEDQTWGKRSYASEATDPQDGEDIFDVYSNSLKIGLNSVPYRKW